MNKPVFSTGPVAAARLASALAAPIALRHGNALPAGSGIAEVSRVAGRSRTTRVIATNPLKLLAPRRPGPAAWIYTSTYGGGMLAGDTIDLQLKLGPGALCVMNTQSSNKIYKSPAGRPSRQQLRAEVADGATLILAPDPVTCFANARYEQDQRVELAASGALVAVDWLTSGRQARGERWAFSRYRSRLDVFVAGRQRLADALDLHPADAPLTSAFRLGRFNCLAMVALVGERFAAAIDDLLNTVGRQPVPRRNAFGGREQSSARCTLIDSISPISGGAVLRILGTTTEAVGQYLRSALAFLTELLGDALWARKW